MTTPLVKRVRICTTGLLCGFAMSAAPACAPATTVDDAVLQMIPAVDSMAPGDSLTIFARLSLSSGEDAGRGRRIELNASAGAFTTPQGPYVVVMTDSNGSVSARYVAPATEGTVAVTAQAGEASASTMIVVRARQTTP